MFPLAVHLLHGRMHAGPRTSVDHSGLKLLNRAQKADDAFPGKHPEHVTVRHHGKLIYPIAIHFLQRLPTTAHQARFVSLGPPGPWLGRRSLSASRFVERP